MSINSTETNWFKDWFNSTYYHLLYNHRDEGEARLFIEGLVHQLKVTERSRVLDLACGKGRHSITLSELGFEVLGVDLAEDSIRLANESARENLSFEVKDMRQLDGIGTFDAVFNLFTSFGYFEDDNDQLKVLNQVNSILNPEGLFVIDFLNQQLVRTNIVPEALVKRELDGKEIIFEIHKELLDNRVVKTIEFRDGEKEFSFQERVRLISQKELSEWMAMSGFEIIHTFGDYNLNNFNLETSPRLILVARKRN
ncbi:MAG: class I SAM-dependent methyltransferase [Flavobacteriales bacterium]